MSDTVPFRSHRESRARLPRLALRMRSRHDEFRQGVQSGSWSDGLSAFPPSDARRAADNHGPSCWPRPRRNRVRDAQPLPAGAVPMCAGYVRRGPGFVDENESSGSRSSWLWKRSSGRFRTSRRPCSLECAVFSARQLVAHAEAPSRSFQANGTLAADQFAPRTTGVGAVRA